MPEMKSDIIRHFYFFAFLRSISLSDWNNLRLSHTGKTRDYLIGKG